MLYTIVVLVVIIVIHFFVICVIVLLAGHDAAVAAARDVVNDLSTSADNIKAEEDDTEKSLAEWVHSMRKAPKKSISEWRHRALDKIGFIW